ncbi:MAG: hypothetical protein CYPHOPRED_004330 [Cyphobasidiales sp. Tagirdzhanova-0007]|nr:MAG: hypothetical protein CYPHOPRED_004330 [Cyphobasidiales sp. Tagirdzhanova-0007]
MLMRVSDLKAEDRKVRSISILEVGIAFARGKSLDEGTKRKKHGVTAPFEVRFCQREKKLVGSDGVLHLIDRSEKVVDLSVSEDSKDSKPVSIVLIPDDWWGVDLHRPKTACFDSSDTMLRVDDLWRHPKIWTRRQAPELLPSSSGKSRRPLPSVHGKFLGSINVNIQFGWLWIEVKSFNESLINILQKTSPAKKTARSGSHRLITGSLSIFYDVGAVVGLAGFLLLPLFLVFLLFSALSAIPVSQTMARTTITGDIQQSTQTAAQAAPFFLLPGITTPLRDLPVTLAAGLFAITWHEFGHAFSAALYGVPLQGIGIIVILLFPGAYVILPKTTLELLPSQGKISIVLAGVWHNLVLWLLIWSSIQVGIGNMNTRIFGLLGCRDYNERGVIVQLVKDTSPLFGILLPRTLVTRLDDLDLHDSNTFRHWDHYLIGDQGPFNLDTGYAHLGCTASPANSNGVCFNDTKGTERCLDPSSVLNTSRCLDMCTDGSTACIFPARQAHLLRLAILNALGTEDIVFYQGPRARLWRDVQVGSLLAPWWLPQTLPMDVEKFFSHVQAISLSLALFNLLPLPYLDGGEVLRILLTAQSPPSLRHVQDAPRLQLFGAILTGIFGSDLQSRLAQRSRRIRHSVQIAIVLLLLSITGIVGWHHSR